MKSKSAMRYTRAVQERGLTLQKNKLQLVTARLFSSDVATLKRIADVKGSRWNIELRQLVRRALKGEQREVLVLKEHR